MSTSSGMLASLTILTEIPKQTCLAHSGNASPALRMLLSPTQGGVCSPHMQHPPYLCMIKQSYLLSTATVSVIHRQDQMCKNSGKTSLHLFQNKHTLMWEIKNNSNERRDNSEQLFRGGVQVSEDWGGWQPAAATGHPGHQGPPAGAACCRYTLPLLPLPFAPPHRSCNSPHVALHVPILSLCLLYLCPPP